MIFFIKKCLNLLVGSYGYTEIAFCVEEKVVSKQELLDTGLVNSLIERIRELYKNEKFRSIIKLNENILFVITKGSNKEELEKKT